MLDYELEYQGVSFSPTIYLSHRDSLDTEMKVTGSFREVGLLLTGQPQPNLV
jgi:hypothetical protein